jgi:LPXTG-site transpeptidase (sortase) family protein
VSTFRKKHFLSLISFLGISILLALPSSVLAEVSIPQTDRTPLAPLPTSAALPVQSDYISGVSLGSANSYAIFYEDKNAGCVSAGNPPYQMYTAQTSSGPFGIGASVALNICESHFIAKNWSIVVGGTTYAYRGWGAGNYNGTHNFYVSNDRIHWTLVSTFTFSHPSDGILYGFHDIVQINGHYLGFVESAGGHTYVVQNTHFDTNPFTDNNFWTVIDPAVGGIGVTDHLRLPGSSGPKPTDNFLLMKVGGQLVYGKLYLPGDSSAAYLIMNAAAAQAANPSAAETAFMNSNDWTWSDGSSGAAPSGSRILIATAARNIRTAWTVPTTSPDSDYVILYSGQYTTPSQRALGCAAADAQCLTSVDDPGGPATAAAGPSGGKASSLFVIPVSGFPPGRVTDLTGKPLQGRYDNSGVTLQIPKLKLNIAVVGVPLVNGAWQVDWLTGVGGWLEGTAYPGLDGNSVITSHVVTHYGSPGPFARLDSLSFGDYIFVNAFDRMYIYEVKSVRNVASTDISIFKHETKPILTLLTCAKYNVVTQTYDARLVVRSEVIQVDPINSLIH